MKQYLIATAIVFLGTSIASAQSFFGPEVQVTDGQISSLFNGLVQKTKPVGIEQAIGFYVFGAVTDTPWAQIHGGVAYSPRKWMTLTAGAGTEKNDDPWRIAGSIFVGNGANAGLLVIENGGSGSWYRVQYTRTLNQRLTVGVFSRRFSPTGPYFEVRMARYTLWTVTGPDLETGHLTSVVGLNVNLP